MTGDGGSEVNVAPRSRSRRPSGFRAAGLALFAWAAAGPARAEPPLTVDQAVEAARAANALLPVARAGAEIGAAGVREARAARWPALSLEGGARYAPPSASYNAAVGPIGEDRLRLLLRQPLYDGGARSARLQAAEARLEGARAGFRLAGREVELAARLRFGEVVEAAAELSARRDGLERLRGYLQLVRQREAAGEGLERDRLRAEARLSAEEGAAAEAERRLARAKLELNDVMGRDPAAPLEVVPPPPPGPAPEAGTGEPWRGAPDLAAAEAARREAVAGVAEARAAQLPRLELTVDAGLFGPGFPAPGTPPALPDRLRSDLGASVGLRLTWPLWDHGRLAARLSGARLRAEWAGGVAEVERRRARLAWRRAETDLAALHREVALRAAAVPRARDSQVLAESLYRGGVGSSLEVLDAYAGLVDAQMAEARAVQRYRAAEAEARRWSEP